MSNEEIEKVTKILSCDNCRTSYACEACDITWSDKQLIKKYISELETSNRELDKENNRLEKIEFERDKANKIIDEMVRYIAKVDTDIFCDEDKYERDIEDNVIGCDEDCEECVKQYFEKKVEGK